MKLKDRLVIMDNRNSLIKEAPVINRTNHFLATPPYVLVVMLLTVIANVFSAELVVYTFFALVAIYTCLLGNDLLPLMPLFIGGYLAPSVENNPGRNEVSVFSGYSGIYLACLSVCIVAALIFRLIKDKQRFFTAKPILLSGMLVLLGAYLLSGIGSAAYPEAIAKNLFFALLQGAAIILPYWLFSCGVNWKNVRKDYFAWIGFATGGVLICQILWIYYSGNVIVDGIIHRKYIFTGWGMYNNIGAMLAMMTPYAFCLASKYRKGWIGTVVGSIFLICLLLTCSRSSILTGIAGYCVCVILMLYHAKNRKHNTIALISISVVILLTIIFFRDQLLRLFSGLINKGLDPSSRDDIYVQGLKSFTKAPIFGNSFFPTGYQPWAWYTTEGFGKIFPPRWHNTIVQLLAGCGIVGLAAYILHRVQTIRLFLQHKTKENRFIACSLLILLVASMFDCHFFNIGPVLFYSMALAFAENRPESNN